MTGAHLRCPVALVLLGERGRVGRVGEGRIRAFQAQRECTRYTALLHPPVSILVRHSLLRPDLAAT